MSAVVTDVLQGLQLLNINVLQPTSQFAIVDADSGAPLVVPDTWRRIDYKSEQRLADYPIEQGGFSSYNKVATPFELHLELCCAGGSLQQQLLSGGLSALDSYVNSLLGTSFAQPMTRSAFIRACESMTQSLQLVDVIMPDVTYEALNCYHFSYSKTREQGASMVRAELWFREIRETAQGAYTSSGTPVINSSSPDAADSVSVGSVTTILPSASQQAIITTGGFA